MDKKGFTLIEILAVIVVISLLLILVTPNILANLSKSRANVSDATKDLIFEAANLHMDDNPDIYKEDVGDTYCITVETLISAGKLVEPFKDASTGKEIDKSTSVRVSISSSGRNMELVKDGTCYDGGAKLLTSDDIVLNASNVTTKGFDVITGFINGHTVSEIAKYDYSINDGSSYDYKNKGQSTRITNLRTNTYKVKVKVTTKDGQVVISKAKEVKLKEIGLITFSCSNMNVCATSKNVKITYPATPNNTVAVSKGETLKYSYTKDSSIDKSKWTVVGVSPTVTVTEEGTMTARVTDGVNEKVESYAIIKIASPNPVVAKASVDHSKEKWYAGRISVTGRVSSCIGTNSGTKITGYCVKKGSAKPGATNSCFTSTGSKNHYANNKNSFGRDNGDYYAFVKDDKNRVSKGVKVKVNWKGKPTCSISFSGTKGNNGWYRSNITAKLKKSGDGKTIRSYKLSGKTRTSMTITKQGSSKVTCNISAGGKTNSGSGSAKKDTGKPSCSASALGYNTTNPRVSFKCSDGVSGCTKSGTTKYGGGTHSYTCKDKAGNKKSVSKYVKRYVPPAPKPSTGGGSSGGSGGGSTTTTTTSGGCKVIKTCHRQQQYYCCYIAQSAFAPQVCGTYSSNNHGNYCFLQSEKTVCTTTKRC